MPQPQDNPWHGGKAQKHAGQLTQQAQSKIRSKVASNEMIGIIWVETWAYQPNLNTF